MIAKCLAVILMGMSIQRSTADIDIKILEEHPGILFNRIEDLMFISDKVRLITSINAGRVFDYEQYYVSSIGNITRTEEYIREKNFTAGSHILTITHGLHTLAAARKQFTLLVGIYSPGAEFFSGEEQPQTNLNLMRASDKTRVKFSDNPDTVFFENNMFDEITELEIRKQTSMKLPAESGIETKARYTMLTVQDNIALANQVNQLLAHKDISLLLPDIFYALGEVIATQGRTLPVKLSELDPETFLKITEVQIHYQGGDIFIIADIQFINNETFRVYQMKSIPTFQKTGHYQGDALYIKPRDELIAIRPRVSHHFFLSETEFQECKKIKTSRICRQPKPLITSADCESELLRLGTHWLLNSCTLVVTKEVDCHIFSTSDPTVWFFSTRRSVNGTEVCDKWKRNITLSNTGLIKIPKNCRLLLNHQVYHGKGSPMFADENYVIPSINLELRGLLLEEAKVNQTAHFLQMGNNIFEVLITLAIVIIINILICMLIAVIYGIAKFKRTRRASKEIENSYVPMAPVDPNFICKFYGPGRIYDEPIIPPVRVKDDNTQSLGESDALKSINTSEIIVH